MQRKDDKTNENACASFGIFGKCEGINCGVVEMVNHSTKKWSNHLDRMRNTDDKKDIYEQGGALSERRIVRR